MPVQRFRVWWIPQVPGEPFYVEVSSVPQGVKIMNTLADYDQFQLDNNIKPDYSNAGGLQMMEDGEWVDWYDHATGEDDPEQWMEDNNNGR